MRAKIAPRITDLIVFLLITPLVCGEVLSLFKKVNMTKLKSTANAFLEDLIDSNEVPINTTQKSIMPINIRMIMSRSLTPKAGCGFTFQARGESSRGGFVRMPKAREHRCNEDDVHVMRTTAANDTYDESVYIGPERPTQVDIFADGVRDTYVDTACVAAAGIQCTGACRAICVDNSLLAACNHQRRHKWDGASAGNDVKMTRTTRGVGQIEFRDLDALFDAFEKMTRDGDDYHARSDVCDRINLVRGADGRNTQTCTAEKKYSTYGTSGVNMIRYNTVEVHVVEIDPAACVPLPDQQADKRADDVTRNTVHIIL